MLASQARRKSMATYRRWMIAAMVLALLPATGAAQKKGKQKEQKEAAIPVPDDQAVEARISEMIAAWQIGDVELLRKYYADDVVVVSGAFEPPLVGWNQFLQSYLRQRQRLQGPRLERANTVIQVRGNLACATYQWGFDGVVDGRPSFSRGHTTLVLEKRKEGWVVVHNHTSVVPGAGTTQAQQPTP